MRIHVHRTVLTYIYEYMYMLYFFSMKNFAIAAAFQSPFGRTRSAISVNLANKVCLVVVLIVALMVIVLLMTVRRRDSPLISSRVVLY